MKGGSSRILHVVGARPNFMKVAPIIAAMQRRRGCFEQHLVHTGQHYDSSLSDVFFADLDLPPAGHCLEVGSGTHAEQTARIMLGFEPVVEAIRPDRVVVVGDVNSTLACTLVCAKLGIAVVHVEAGLRSFDMTMPEEVNRIVTDRLSSLLLTPSRDADRNLIAEGIDPATIRFVGNVMIDSLVRCLPLTERRAVMSDLQLDPGRYVVATLHRPSNVDEAEVLQSLLEGLRSIGETLEVVLPLHPRTRARLESGGLDVAYDGLRLLEPLGYLDFLALMRHAAVVLTDSGGIQEECTWLKVPCVTARPNTERPVTVECGCNVLVESRARAVSEAVLGRLDSPRDWEVPPLWDGGAAERITDALLAL